jgi:riboflavin kinase / FMN adenylyltransferase
MADVPGPVVLAIGVFDGVHPGHRAVLQRAIDNSTKIGGTPIAATFHPHPAKILRPGRAPHLLTSLPHKRRLIAALGFEYLLVIPFTPDLAATPPRDFLFALAGAARPLAEVVVGCGWSFGKNRAGSVDMIRGVGGELGFSAVEIPSIEIGGAPVSSTRIRNAIKAGDFETARTLLGRPYTILGTVIKGRQLGRTLGFPTANLRAHNEQFPPDGVYAILAAFPDDSTRHGVANIGVRPTLESDGEKTLEVHFPNFSGNLYGIDLEITFLQFLRPEMRFPNPDALKAQISKDIAAAAAPRTFEKFPDSPLDSLKGEIRHI